MGSHLQEIPVIAGVYVSNLLSSPASGESEDYPPASQQDRGFQFIEFPSEWGEPGIAAPVVHLPGFQFIEFPSEWGDSTVDLGWRPRTTFPIY